MKNLIRLKKSRAVRLTASAVAAAAVVAGVTGIVPGQGNAAPASKANKATHSSKKSGFKQPKLKHGVLTVKGTEAGEKIALRLQAGEPGILQIDVGDDGSADFSFERAEIAKIAVGAGDGNDLVRIDESNGAVNAGIPTTIDGGDGNDTLAGGTGIETLLGGDGNDSIDGNGGNDVAFMGDGEDTFVWDPGDGSDVVEGQDGADTMLFNGAGGAEQVDLSANGNRLRFFRTQGAITMDTAGVERVDFIALGGADTATVNDLSGTDVSEVNVDLAATLGGATGDGQIDRVVVNGTNGKDAITVSGKAAGVTVAGLRALVAIQHQESTDQLDVNGLAGDDAIDASGLAAGVISLALDGGAGNDTINGGDGAERLLGGDGDDAIDGNGGADTALMGAGADTFVWDPGDGSDVVEGQDGADTMLFNGAGGAENFDLSANGNRLRFFRTQGAITMDLNDTENIDVQALGGADAAVVNDTTGTDLKRIVFDLAAAIGGGAGDGAADSVTVNGSNNPDDIQVTAIDSAVGVFGVQPTILIDHSEAANDKLTVNGLGGDDDVAIGPGVAGLIQTLVNLGGDE